MRILLSIAIFILVLLPSPAADMASTGGTAVVQYVFQVNLKYQAYMGFTTQPDNVKWNMDSSASSSLDDVSSVKLSYKASDQSTSYSVNESTSEGNDAASVYFYYALYLGNGGTVGFVPGDMESSEDGYEPISYDVVLTPAVNEDGEVAQTEITVGSGVGHYFTYEGNDPAVQVYELDFKLGESDFPAVMSGSYTGNIVVSYTAT